jgi:hypothetical protein
MGVRTGLATLSNLHTVRMKKRGVKPHLERRKGIVIRLKFDVLSGVRAPQQWISYEVQLSYKNATLLDYLERAFRFVKEVDTYKRGIFRTHDHRFPMEEVLLGDGTWRHETAMSIGQQS